MGPVEERAELAFFQGTTQGKSRETLGPAGVFRPRCVWSVGSVVGVAQRSREIGQMESRVLSGPSPERCRRVANLRRVRQVVARLEIPVGILRQLGVAVHSISFHSDQIRSDVALLENMHPHSLPACEEDGRLMERPVFTEKHQVGGGLVLQCRGKELVEFPPRTAKSLGPRQRPVVLVPRTKVDARHASTFLAQMRP